MKTILHLHQQRLKKGLDPIIVRTYKGVQYARRVRIEGPSQLEFSDTPLACGARAWITTQAKVVIEEQKDDLEVLSDEPKVRCRCGAIWLDDSITEDTEVESCDACKESRAHGLQR